MCWCSRVAQKQCAVQVYAIPALPDGAAKQTALDYTNFKRHYNSRISVLSIGLDPQTVFVTSLLCISVDAVVEI